MKDGSCLTDRKSTHMEAHGSTLILTVDDEPTNHLVIEEIVTSQGYQVQQARARLTSPTHKTCISFGKGLVNISINAVIKSQNKNLTTPKEGLRRATRDLPGFRFFMPTRVAYHILLRCFVGSRWRSGSCESI